MAAPGGASRTPHLAGPHLALTANLHTRLKEGDLSVSGIDSGPPYGDYGNPWP